MHSVSVKSTVKVWLIIFTAKRIMLDTITHDARASGITSHRRLILDAHNALVDGMPKYVSRKYSVGAMGGFKILNILNH